MTDAASLLYDLKGKRVWVAGHKGMVGSALMRRLAEEDCTILTVDRGKLDLRRQDLVECWFNEHKPDAVILAAAKVGGIQANRSLPAEFLYDNLMIEANIINGAYQAGVGKLLFLGSSCIYPRDILVPISEEHLLTGPLETTNQCYAIAKIAGIKLCQAYQEQYQKNFISVMPTNLYGPGDNFHPEYSHVPAALLRRIHEAKMAKNKSVIVWGTGTPRREFLHVDDMADACVFLMKHYSEKGPINVGTGSDLAIADFVSVLQDVVGYHCAVEFNHEMPDGSPRKILDVSKINNLGWTAKIPIKDGLRKYYQWFLENIDHLRK